MRSFTKLFAATSFVGSNRVRRPLVGLVAACAAVLLPATVALASAPVPTPPRLVSGPDPLDRKSVV